MTSAPTVFVDTNVLVYAEDRAAGTKQASAFAWLRELWLRRAGRLSVQVLNEFYVCATRKLAKPMPPGDARAEVRRYQLWRPWSNDHATVEAAWAVESRHKFSYWDALIIAAAQAQGCRYLLSEDLQHEQDIDGVKVINPFLAGPDLLGAFNPLAVPEAMTADLDTLIRTRIRQDVQSMHAYAIQPSAGLIKLDAMENPHSLPPELQRELGERLARVAINRYPAGGTQQVIEALAAHVDLPRGAALMLGNGSDEIITMLSMAVDVPGNTILAPLPGFVMYEMSARLQGLPFVGVPLTADFRLDEPAMLAAIDRHRPAITYIAYPNNPTANLFDDAVIDRVVGACAGIGGLVVFDEAYQPFSSRTWMQRMASHPHVLVMRTLSKFGLAGVRLGYLAGAQALIEQVDKVRPPYNVSVLNAEATLFALEHAPEYARQAARIRAEREALQPVLRAIPGVTPFPSDANMILVRVPDSAAAFEGMKRRGVLVKHIAGLHPLLANCLRLTVGTAEENRAMVEALKASL